MSIETSIGLIMELEKLKSVQRKTKVKSDNNRQENSAEHSWHASLLAFALSDFIDIQVDINKVIKMLLIHDIVEIYAGDMFAFADEQQKIIQEKNEYNAINQLYEKFPINKAKIIKELWLEFEEGKTLEAKFALSMDRIAPFLINMHNGGGSWLEFGISKSQILKRNQVLKEVSHSLWEYFKQQLDKAIANGWIIDN